MARSNHFPMQLMWRNRNNTLNHFSTRFVPLHLDRVVFGFWRHPQHQIVHVRCHSTVYGRMARSTDVVLDRRRVVSIIVITTSRLPYKSLDWPLVLPLNHTLLMWLRNILS